MAPIGFIKLFRFDVASLVNLELKLEVNLPRLNVCFMKFMNFLFKFM